MNKNLSKILQKTSENLVKKEAENMILRMLLALHIDKSKIQEAIDDNLHIYVKEVSRKEDEEGTYE